MPTVIYIWIWIAQFSRSFPSLSKEMAQSGAGNKKPEEVQPHPVKEQLPGVQYCINSPPPWRPCTPFSYYNLFFFKKKNFFAGPEF